MYERRRLLIGDDGRHKDRNKELLDDKLNLFEIGANLSVDGPGCRLGRVRRIVVDLDGANPSVDGPGCDAVDVGTSSSLQQ